MEVKQQVEVKEQVIRAVKTVKLESLQQQNIVIEQTQSKHIKVESGNAYQVILQKHDTSLEIDFNVLAKKQGSDLVLLLDDQTTVIFDDYFTVCLDGALGCVVSLPSEGGLYHVSDAQFKVLDDGTELVYFYGDPSALKGILADSPDNGTLADFVEQYKEESSSLYSYTTLGLGALAVIAFVASNNSDDDDGSTKFTVSGNISAGQVVEGHDLTLRVYDKYDEEVDSDEATIEDNGSFSINITKEYTGYLIVKVTSSGGKKDYLDEGTNEEKSLSTSFRAIIKAEGTKDITVMVNPLTEIVVRKIFSEVDGASNGQGELKDVDDVEASLATANTAVNKAFQMDNVDISSTQPAIINADSYDSSASTNAKALGYILSGISGMETYDRKGKLDSEKDTAEVLKAIVEAIDDNGVLKEIVKADFLAGLNQADKETNPGEDDVPSSYSEQFKSIITYAGIKISNDKDALGENDNDFLTNTEQQTITATLKVALSGDEELWGSVDSGATWKNINKNNEISDRDISWNVDLQEGEYIIQFAITADTATKETVNYHVKGEIALQSYTLDTTAPEKVTIEKVITEDNINLASGETTNDETPIIRISLKNGNNTIAEKDDRIQIKVDDGTGYTHSKYVTLSENDIEKGWKEIELNPLNSSEDNDNKEYKFKAYIIDQAGNKNELADEYSIIYDGKVEALTLALKEDTGVSTTDEITSNKTIIIGNIEEGAKVEYILDGGDEWQTLASNKINYADDKGIAQIDLAQDAIYKMGSVKVRQTDGAGNTNTSNDIAKNAENWVIDKTAAKYEKDDKLDFVRIFGNDDSSIVKEVRITLKFDEDIEIPDNFNKDSFEISGFNNGVETSKTISKVEIDDTDSKKVVIYISGDVTEKNITLLYKLIVDAQPLQDKAGNAIATIAQSIYSLDQDEPGKITIQEAIANNNNSLSSGKTTNDRSVSIRIDLNTDNLPENARAKSGDKIQILEDGFHSQYVTLDRVDINNKYKVVELLEFNTGGGNSDETYIFTARVIDQSGNIGALSSEFLITYDSHVDALTLHLNDTGVDDSDGISNNRIVEINNVENGATVEYSLNNTDWITLNNNNGFSFSLGENSSYESRSVQVRQTDKAGNVSSVNNTKAWQIDNTAPTYEKDDTLDFVRILGDDNSNDSTKVKEVRITLKFDEEIIKPTDFSNNSFIVQSFDSEDSLTDQVINRVEINDKKVMIYVSGDISENNIKLSSSRANNIVFLQDKAGNSIANIEASSYALDNTKPAKVTIEKATSNDKNNIANGDTTNNSLIIIRVNLEGTDAKSDDKIQILQDGSHSMYVTLSENDISNKYKNINLPSLSSGDNQDDKTYIFEARVIDQVGNLGILSEKFLITYDTKVTGLELRLNDTGFRDDDGITNSKTIVIDNIEEDAVVEYTLNNRDWITINNASNASKFTINLEENGNYSRGSIRAKQTDEAGNVSNVRNLNDWQIDNTKAIYELDSELDFVRIFEDDQSTVKETKITLTFDENIIKPATFRKESFAIKVGDSESMQAIDRVEVIDKKVSIYFSGDIMSSSTTNEISIAYEVQADIKENLQDIAGNSIAPIVEKSYSVDKVNPLQPSIVSIIDDRGTTTGEVGVGQITDDSSLQIQVSLEKDSQVNAVAGDILFFYNDGKNLETIYELTAQDVDNKIASLTLNFDTSAEGETYKLGVRIRDKSGNMSNMSELKEFTVDAQVAQATINLKFDTGVNFSDRITSSAEIEVSNIEKDATWQYSVDGGDNWKEGNGGKTSHSLTDEFSFDLEQNKTYDSQDIQVRQTDRTGNTNGDSDHTAISHFSQEITTDNISPEYQSQTRLANSKQIALGFSEDLYVYSTSGTSDSDVTSAFVVKINDITTTVVKVAYNGKNAILTLSSNFKDSDTITIEYQQSEIADGSTTDQKYSLQDKAGNLVDDFKVGDSSADNLTAKAGVNNTIIGNGGNDTLSGGTGIDTFDYNATTDGNDTIDNFTNGSDKLDFKDLLDGYDSNSTLDSFIRSEDSGGKTVVKVDANGAIGNDGSFVADIEITLTGVTGIDLTTMINNGDLIVL
ncbi:hypothetical protein THERMOT_1223 [Bathymodiolus thermophilus thioautotrophic gill symbiont]|uniref:SwmB domain-containing protein n=1 Tax=Bathymodiolus thermophilus thioautotrophic gill symbiont TaxID=2360 RepID=UPI00192BDF33|nr:SwmB domain-containing protein [Bathymodiolus thermophilus thioautotrophic gill symbiont]CAB5500374.1 hypothetical protein THERMOT_1223 [Bathymodiolus thermophilus thioautotrophic gill symbiont]